MKKIIYSLFLLLPMVSMGQETIHGVVIDKRTRAPINEAIVWVNKTKAGTYTDFDGQYALKATLNDTLVVSAVGMKTQKAKVLAPEMNFELEELLLKEEFGLPKKTAYKQMQTPTARDIINGHNAKYHFKKNAQQHVFVIFVADLTSYDFSPADLAFQQKYNVKYSILGSYPTDYIKEYNRLTFKYLKNKYKTHWRAEIRKDAVGFKNE